MRHGEVIMNSLKDKLLNILLYPARIFEKLTDKRATLYAGIVLIGAIDLLLPDAAAVLKFLFTGKTENVVYMNAALAVIVLLVLGVIDVVFIGVPLFDFFKFIKKKEGKVLFIQGQEKENEQNTLPVIKMEDRASVASRIKIMKIYIMSHFIIIPVSIIIHYSFLRYVEADSPAWMQYLALAIFMLIFIWSAAILTRGINTLFRFNPIFARLTFIIVFTWNYLFSMVFDMQIMNWLLKLFR